MDKFPAFDGRGVKTVYFISHVVMCFIVDLRTFPG